MSMRSKLLALASIAFALTWSSAVHAADKVTFVTDFGYLGRHAYYFVALDKGYYKAANLDVDIVRGQGSADAVKQVAAGTAQIGFADAASLILARANDNVPVKMVAVIYDKAPHAIFALKGSGISKPKDLEGRNVADAAASSIPKMFPAYAKAAGIDASKVKWTVVASDAIAATLALGRADAVGYYTISEALLKKTTGKNDLIVLRYSDAGFQSGSCEALCKRHFARSQGRDRESGRSRGNSAQISAHGRCRRWHGRNEGGCRSGPQTGPRCGEDRSVPHEEHG
jgi:NitT/TauT family transport system substrate-binding protein